jgi:hypothetical protein
MLAAISCAGEVPVRSRANLPEAEPTMARAGRTILRKDDMVMNAKAIEQSVVGR